MPLPQEKIAELQTLAELLGAKPAPSPATINSLYDKHLARLSMPQEPESLEDERERERVTKKQAEDYRQRQRRS